MWELRIAVSHGKIRYKYLVVISVSQVESKLQLLVTVYSGQTAFKHRHLVE
jgi:hypothetical protein